MAETLASTLNPSPFDPIGAVGNIMGESSGAARGKKARELTEPLMRAKVEAESDLEREQARLEKEQFQRQAQVEEGSVKRLEGLQEGLKRSFEGRPEAQITAFNPEKGMELAGLTALMGVFGGMISGRAGLAAMEGVAEGYRTGQQDLYKIEVEKFNRELDKYKDKIKQAETIYNEAIKLEQARKGAGLAKLKELSPVLQSSYLDAKNRVRPFAGAEEALKQAKKHEELIEKAAVEAGLRADKKTGLKPGVDLVNKHLMKMRLSGYARQMQEALKDPAFAQKIDQYRALAFAQEQSPIADQILQQNIPEDVRAFLILAKRFRNEVYRTESGLAVTAYEQLRQYGAVPQPGDSARALVTKLKTLERGMTDDLANEQRVFPDLLIASQRAGLSPVTQGTAAPAAQQNLPTPQTQEEFDALPAGALYIDPDDGKQYRKPQGGGAK